MTSRRLTAFVLCAIGATWVVGCGFDVYLPPDQGERNGDGGDGGEPPTAPAPTQPGCVVQGPLSPRSSEDGGSGNAGVAAWQSVGAVAELDGSTASVNMTLEGPSHDLVANDFGFQLPENALVLGIEVEISKASNGLGNVTDRAVRIVKNGSPGWINEKQSVSWPGVLTYAEYGAPGVRWGEEWTADEINAPSFGVAIAAGWSGTDGIDQARIDHVRMSVTYCP
jgi:hypothetical protein